jgi:hypothetical protein
LLAKQQMKMEGSVVLLAGIGKDGSIQNLQVISGLQRFFLLPRVKPSSNGALSVITSRGRRTSRRLKNCRIECSNISGFPLSRFAPARKSAQIISRQ